MKYRNFDSRVSAAGLLLVFVLCVGVAPGVAHAQSPNDDDSNAAFVRQVLPFVLGRRALNTTEVRLLADLIEIRGREQVLRSLMKRPEYLAYWTNNMANIMRAQRVRSGNDDLNCMNAPLRLAGPDGSVQADNGALALHVGGHLSDASVNSTFNWYDLTYSSLDLDSLVPAYRAYLYIRAFEAKGTDADNRERGVHNLTTELLNRNANCAQCHLGESGAQNTADWDKQHPLHSMLDTNMGFQPDLTPAFALFRGDLFFYEADEPPGVGPWGMSTACARMLAPGSAVATDDELDDVNFAGLSGGNLSIEDLADQLMWGFDDLDTTPMPLSASPEDGGSAFAYLLAAQVVNAVWENIMGQPLTLAHGYARNVHQKALHRYLTEEVFLAGQWSLRDLLVGILLSPEFNRRAPLNSARPTPSELLPLFNAMLMTGPCDAEPTPVHQGPGELIGQMPPVPGVQVSSTVTVYSVDAPPSAASGLTNHVAIVADAVLLQGPVSGCTNSQGEIIHRHNPISLLGSVGAALGWRQAPIVPDSDDYPNEALMFNVGQYLGRTKPGLDALDYSSYLAWESAMGQCSSSGRLPPGQAADWITVLMSARAQFNASHPQSPARVIDMVAALKDRILQRPIIGGYEPQWSDGASSTTTTEAWAFDTGGEWALLQTFMGVALNSPAPSGGPFEAKLRTLCGVYLTSPQFMLTGVDSGEAHQPPRMQVCLAGEPCTYQAICNTYRAMLPSAGELYCATDQVTANSAGFQVDLPPMEVTKPPLEMCFGCQPEPEYPTATIDPDHVSEPPVTSTVIATDIKAVVDVGMTAAPQTSSVLRR